MSRPFVRLGVHSKSDVKLLAAQFIKFEIISVSNTAVGPRDLLSSLWIHPNLYIVGTVFGTVPNIANVF